MSTVLIPEQDAGINYALTREAKDAAEKYNNAIKRISAFTKRKGALSKAMKSGQNVAELEEKIEEFEHSLNIAETEKAKAVWCWNEELVMLSGAPSHHPKVMTLRWTQTSGCSTVLGPHH